MTHDRSGSALLGGAVFLILAGDVAYVAARWSGESPRFHWAFLFGVAAMLLTLTVSKILAADQSLPRNRDDARWIARRNNQVLIEIGGVILGVTFLFGPRAMYGVILGQAAAGCSFFIVFAVYWILCPHPVGRETATRESR
jgi:hypothetical protein